MLSRVKRLMGKDLSTIKVPKKLHLSNSPPLPHPYVDDIFSRRGARRTGADTWVAKLVAPPLEEEFIARLLDTLCSPAFIKLISSHVNDCRVMEWIFTRDELNVPTQWPLNPFFARTAMELPLGEEPDEGHHRDHCQRGCKAYEWIFNNGPFTLHLTIWGAAMEDGKWEACKARLRFNPTPTRPELLAANSAAFKLISAAEGLQITRHLPMDLHHTGILAVAKANNGLVNLDACGNEVDLVARTIQYFIDTDVVDFCRVGLVCTWQITSDLGTDWPAALPYDKGHPYVVDGVWACRYTIPNCRLRHYKFIAVLWPTSNPNVSSTQEAFATDSKVKKIEVRFDDLLPLEEDGVNGLDYQVEEEGPPVVGRLARAGSSLRASLRRRPRCLGGESGATTEPEGYANLINEETESTAYPEIS